MRYVIYLAIGIIVILVIISTILRKRIYKEVDRFDEWKNEILHRPISDEIAKLKHLQMSGQTEQKFEEWRGEWDEIVGTILPDIEERLFDIEDLAVKYRFSKAKQLIELTDQRLQAIEEQLARMLSEIDHLVQSEEKNRTEINDVRTKYKEYYALMMKKRGLLGKGLSSFDDRFGQVKINLEEFDEATIEGSYLKAREKLQEAHVLLEETKQLLDQYPQLLVQVESEIPAEMNELREGIKEMEGSGYHLDSFELSSRFDLFNEALLAIQNELDDLNCDNAVAQLEDLSEQINQVYRVLEFEVESRQFVAEQLPLLHDQIEATGRKIDSLLEETVNVQRSYHISNDQLKKQESMRDEVLTLNRQLQVINDVTDSEKLTYTAAREMINKWLEDLTGLSNAVDDEKQSLHMLRDDEWQAKETLTSLRSTLLETKRMIQKSNIPGLPEQTLSQLEQADAKIIEATQQLEQVPLEIGRMNVLVQEAVQLVENNEKMIQDTIHLASFAETTIQFGNRFRRQSTAVEKGLSEAETLFRECYYEDAIECAVEVIKPFDPDILDRVEEYLNHSLIAK